MKRLARDDVALPLQFEFTDCGLTVKRYKNNAKQNFEYETTVDMITSVISIVRLVCVSTFTFGHFLLQKDPDIE